MSQYSRVLTILETADGPLALFEIAKRIKMRFRLVDSEAGISARIREIRKNLEFHNKKTIIGVRAGDGKHNHIYAIANKQR